MLLTHNETSTGVTNPVAALAAVARELAPGALILVDGVSALGAVPFEMDAWGLDVVITGSQKAWMAAPGMSMIALSERAWTAAAEARMPRFYFDLRDARKTAANGQTPWTPRSGGDVPGGRRPRVDGGRDAGRASSLATPPAPPRPARGWRRSASGCSPTRRLASNTVTAAWIPEDLDWKTFNGDGEGPPGLILAGGQGKLKGKIFRVGHLGAVNLDDILGAIGVMEEVALAVRPAGGAGCRRGRGPARRPRRCRDRARGSPGDLGMRILVAEPLAREGIEILGRTTMSTRRSG